MAYIGTTINQSPTIAGTLGADIAGDCSFLAVKCDANGAFVLATAGDAAIGVITPGHASDLKTGAEVTVQVKDIGLAKAGAAIAKGAAVATNADGKFVTAVATNFIVGFAMNAAEAANDVFMIQITKSGYKPA
ncbi:MAG: capsid cement protein [Eubacteriaceae bacterium]|nr:capsid cement protein [Eubacteriaceae bacterium]